MRKILVVTLLFAFNASASDYICKPDVAAGARQYYDGTSSSGKYEADTTFYLSKVNGEWGVKEKDYKELLFDKCISEYQCEYSQGYRGVFTRSDNDLFRVFMTIDMSRKPGIESIIYAGKCTKSNA